MATQGLSLTSHNLKELEQAFSDAPIESWRFAKNEMQRFAKRVRRKTIRSMSGRRSVMGQEDEFGRAKGKPRTVQAKSASEPLHGGQFKQGKHIQGFATGGDLPGLKAISTISRILRVHEEGATITPTKAAALYLSRKTNTLGAGRIFARAKSVVIPKRLHFQEIWESEIPDGARRVMDGVRRALRVVMDRRLKALSATIHKIAGV